MEVNPSKSLGSFEPVAWRMNVRRMPSAPPNSPASNTTLSRGDAWPGRIRRGPVVLGEHERGEIDLLGELDEPVEGRPPRVEGGRPGLDVGDVLEPPRDRLEQFGLLARRPEEDARLVHARFMMTDMAHTLRRGPRAGILRAALNKPDLSPAPSRIRGAIVGQRGPR